MSKVTRGSDDKPSQPVSTGALLTLTFLDTTWRMAIPTIGLTVLGLYLDRQFGSLPWLMIAGVVVGSAIAIYLVYIQLKNTSRTKEK
jgi:uncharacterized membrane protein